MDIIVNSCGHVILTFTECSTNLILMEKLPHGRKVTLMAKVVVRMLFPYGNTVKTIITDNGG